MSRDAVNWVRRTYPRIGRHWHTYCMPDGDIFIGIFIYSIAKTWLHTSAFSGVIPPWVNPRRMNKVFCVLGVLRARSGNSFCDAARGRSVCDPSTLLRGRSALREWSMLKLLWASSRDGLRTRVARVQLLRPRAIPPFSLSPSRNIIRFWIPRDHGDSRIVAKYAGSVRRAH